MVTQRRLLSLYALLAILVCLASPFPVETSSVPGPGGSNVSASTDPTRLPASTGGSPVMFVENVGQFDQGAKFGVLGGNGLSFLASDSLWYSVLEKPAAALDVGTTGRSPSSVDPFAKANPAALENQPRKGVNLKVSFVGANPNPRIEPFNRLETHVSYFMGNDPTKWHPDVPVWGGVRYVDLYPGLDLEVTSENGRYVQRMVAKPGADLDKVRMRVEGADSLSLAGDSLLAKTAVGEFSLSLLQMASADGSPTSTGTRKPELKEGVIARPFSSPPASEVKSSVGSPGLIYSTFLGGSGDASTISNDQPYALKVDGFGSAYVAGCTSSTDFPTTPGAYDTSNNGSVDAFVVKLDPQGSALKYATFIGGSHGDAVEDLAVDSAGAAYIGGLTSSTDFPTTLGAFDTAYNDTPEGAGMVDKGDSFAAKLNSDGTTLVYSTFVGGENADVVFAVALGPSGSLYLTGFTISGDFPTTPGAFDSAPGGVFVTKLNPAGSALEYSTSLGGGWWGTTIAVDGSGAAYVGGMTGPSDFPTTPGAYDTTFNGGSPAQPVDGFVAKLNSLGSALEYSTFLGGSTGGDWVASLAIDSSGAAYLGGRTASSDFPTTPGAYDTSFNGPDVFVTKLNSGGSALEYSTFLNVGDIGSNAGQFLTVDESGTVYLTGLYYPSGRVDAFVAKLNPSGRSLAFGPSLAGSDWDQGYAIAVDSSNAVYVAGITNSTDFPTTPGAFDTSKSGGDSGDSFVSKVAFDSLRPVYQVTASANPLSGGTIIPGSGNYAGPTTFIAAPAPGWAFQNWTINGVTASTSNPLKLDITGPVTLGANFNGELTNVIHLPVIMDNAYGGWNSGVSVRNPSPDDARVEIVYYDSQGVVVGTDLQTVAGNGSWGDYQGGKLGGNWAGSATVLSDKPIVASVNETGPGSSAMGYSGVITPSTTLYLPVVMNNAYGGWSTGIGIRNTSPNATPVTISYYDSGGNPAGSDSAWVEANGYWGVYQGGKLGEGWLGSAVITSTQPIAAVVNEVDSSGKAISYNAFSSGSTIVNLPTILNNAYGGWTTGVAIQNTSDNPAVGTISYYQADGALAISQTIGLPPKGYLGLYQGSGDLPDGFAGSATITVNQEVVAVVNESKTPGDAMGYSGVITPETVIDLAAVLDNAYGGWNTGVGLQNTTDDDALVTITYYGGDGSTIKSEGKTILGHGFLGLYQGGQLSDQAGSARVVSSQPLALIVNEIGPGGAAISYNGTQ